MFNIHPISRWQTASMRERMKFILVAILGLMLFLGLTRLKNAIVLKYHTQAEALPLVSTVSATLAPQEDKIILPGSVSAWHEAPIYARTQGYIKQWLVDIGSVVKAGDLLAIIETPELDAQLRQAEANLNVAIANNQLAQTTAVRWKNLLKTDSVSKQETEEKIDTAAANAAHVMAARAERDRLRELVGFEHVTAPFNGIISARTTDTGALINAGSKPSEAKPLFRIVQIDPLRLYVKIPQTYTSRITARMKVQLQFAEHPGRLFTARLFNTAHAIDPITRTLLAQFTVSNQAGLLLPGSYTQVHFSLPSLPNTVRLPVNTLIFRKEGLQVALLDKNNRVVLRDIHVHRDFGNEVEIDTGITPGEAIILNPPDSIYAGEQMRLVGEKKSTS